MATWTDHIDKDTGDIVTETDWETVTGNQLYLLEPNRARTTFTDSADITTTSTSWVTVDGSLTVSLTTHGGTVELIFSFLASGSFVYFDINVDGTRWASTWNTNGAYQVYNDGQYTTQHFSIIVEGLDAGLHTFTPVWKVDTGTGTLYVADSDEYAVLEVREG